MKVTLRVDGREIIISNVESITIDEEKNFSKITELATMKTMKVSKKPTEGEWFEVKPLTIPQELFQRERRDERQERTRVYILEAFAELKKNPNKYGRNFKSMIPKKEWSNKTVEELKALACKLGDHNADWVEQSLEWAQRICNGESWEEVCNNPDTANWYRLVISKDGYARLVGGSRIDYDLNPASDVCDDDFYSDLIIDYTVPLVVRYEK